MRRLLRRTLPCLLIPLTGAVLAQDDGRPVAGKEKARVSVNMLRTVRGGATDRFMSSSDSLAPGEKILPTVFAAGGVVPQGCGAEMTFQAPETVLNSHPLVWTVNVEVRSVSTDAIVLGVEWARLTRGRDGPRKVAGVSTPEQITLREGERALLDFADRLPSGESLCGVQSFAIEVTAQLAEDPALARRQIGYDLWLVHDAPGGRRASRHLGLTTTQGEESAFQFPHQRLPVADTKVDGPETELQVNVRGTLRGRVRPDGTIDLSLGTERVLWYVSSDGSGEHVGDGGQKLLHVQRQETIRVDLPGATRNTQQPDRYARDLSGHSFALILRARTLEPEAVESRAGGGRTPAGSIKHSPGKPGQ